MTIALKKFRIKGKESESWGKKEGYIPNKKGLDGSSMGHLNTLVGIKVRL